jgi:hypothetical protein
MAQQPVARKQPRSKRDKPQETKSDHGQNGHDDQLASYEEELAGYLQERIKPGLNSGAIPLLARSIAKEIAHREPPSDLSEEGDAEGESRAEADDETTGEAEDEPTGEAEDEPTGEAEDEDGAEAEDEPSADADEDDSAESEAQAGFEADMHDLQAELGEDWILRFSVQGEDAWLTAEKDDGSQRVEAPTAAVLTEAVGLLNERGGRSA